MMPTFVIPSLLVLAVGCMLFLWWTVWVDTRNGK